MGKVVQVFEWLMKKSLENPQGTPLPAPSGLRVVKIMCELGKKEWE